MSGNGVYLTSTGTVFSCAKGGVASGRVSLILARLAKTFARVDPSLSLSDPSASFEISHFADRDALDLLSDSAGSPHTDDFLPG